MTSFEPVQAGPYLLPSNPPDLAAISKAIVDWAAPRINMRFASAAARAAAVPVPLEGMVSWLADVNALYVYNGAAWVPPSALERPGTTPFAQAAGSVSLAGTAVAAGGAVSVVISFPVGRFTVVPLLQASMGVAPGGAALLTLHASASSTTNATIYLYNASGAVQTWVAMAITWSAVQMTSAAAAG